MADSQKWLKSSQEFYFPRFNNPLHGTSEALWVILMLLLVLLMPQRFMNELF